MKKAIAIVALLAATVALTGCAERTSTINERHDQRYYACLKAGGSWIEDGWGESCVMPGLVK